ncbi:MAG: FAD-dependent oxidoreductase [Chloroflexota bacterium]
MKLTINDREIEARDGMTVLEASQQAGFYIPTLCYHPLLSPDGTCGLCLVEIAGMPEYALACNTVATEGMVISTDTSGLQEKRRQALRKILAYHPCSCLVCERRHRCQPYDICLRHVSVTQRCILCPNNDQCELQRVADYVALEGEEFSYTYRNLPVDRDNPLYERDYNLCIGCSRCVRACQEIRGIEAIKMTEQEDYRIPQPAEGKSLVDSGCKYCCACVEVCPTGALIDKDAKYQPGIDQDVLTNPCSYNCPAHIDVPRYVRLCGEGKFAEALAVVRERVPFPGALGRVCIHPCETACRRQALNEAISIKSLKLAAAERDDRKWKAKVKKLPPTGKSVAVVGAGPAGLTAAYYLAKQGHRVTVLEALPVAGGMMRVGIPDYRLPPEKLEAEISEIRSAGVEMKFNTRVTNLDELFQQGFNAIFVAPGAHKGQKMRLEGEDSPGVVDGATFLRDVSLGKKVAVGNRVAVVGGGNVAIDSARTALRLGAKEVSIVYRRTRAEMPASEEEVEAALEENIKLVFLAAPLKVTQENNHLKLTLSRMELGAPDESGRRQPVPVKGGEFTLDFNNIISAIGQAIDIPPQFGLKLGKGNSIVVNERNLATSKPGVYAGGDAVTGPASVIQAIAAGRKAAESIDEFLGGTGDISEELTGDSNYNPCVGKDKSFYGWKRAVMPALPVAQRINNFTEVDLGLPEEAAVLEGRRCLQCAVRKLIKPPPPPPTPGKSKSKKLLKVA